MEHVTERPVSAKIEKIAVGPDQVEITATQVIINARHPMPDWQVREYSRIPIYFRDQKYFLRQKSAGQKPFAARYLLELWPADNKEIAPTTFDYNEEVVKEREAAIRGRHFETVVQAALLLVYPLVGLFWSKTKDNLARFGVAARTTTGISIMLTFGLVLLDGVFAKMLLMGSLKTGRVAVGGILRTFAGQDHWEVGSIALPIVWFDVALFIVLVLDVLLRYSQHLRDDGVNFGFMEWMAGPFRGRKLSERAQASVGPRAQSVEQSSAPTPVPVPAPAAECIKLNFRPADQEGAASSDTGSQDSRAVGARVPPPKENSLRAFLRQGNGHDALLRFAKQVFRFIHPQVDVVVRR
jgi:hypothetical protein